LYDDEQKKLREAFLKGVGSDDEAEEVEEEEEDDEDAENGDSTAKGKSRKVSDAGGMLRAKSLSASDAARERLAAAAQLAHALTVQPAKAGAPADATDAFLQDFIMHERWRDQQRSKSGDSDEDDDATSDNGGGGRGGEGSDVEMDDDEDLAEVDRMERFESKFNFRFEEEEAARQAVKAKSAATFFAIQPQTAQQPGISVRTPYEALAIKRHDCIRSINEPFCLILVCCVRIVNLSLSSTASLGAPSRVRLCFVAVVSLSLSLSFSTL
jgi:hypothetical protein